MKLVLICTPTWNKAHFLRDTLYSLQVTADTGLYRHVVVINGGNDDTKRVCRDYGLEWIHNLDNVGIAQSLNQCLTLLTPGQRFMKLDDDLTFFDTGWLEAMLQILDNNEGIGGVAIPRLGREADQLCKSIDAKSEPWIVDSGELWWTNCALYRWKAIQALGSFWQPGLYGYEDVLTGVRLRKLGWRTVYLASYRVRHEGSWKGKRETREYREWKATTRTRSIQPIIAQFKSGARKAYIPLETTNVGTVQR